MDRQKASFRMLRRSLVLWTLIFTLGIMGLATPATSQAQNANEPTISTLPELPGGGAIAQTNLPLATATPEIVTPVPTPTEAPIPAPEPTIAPTAYQSSSPSPFSGEKMPNLEVIPDPHEGFNRGMFGFDKAFLKGLGLPVSKGYSYLVPEGGRRHIRQMGTNLGWPVRFFNTIFQGRIVETGIDTSRFLINTTVGVLGLFDPARYIGLEPVKADFGQTLAVYGSGTGGYWVLPFLGPNSRRDTIGWVFDTLLNPTTYIPGAGILFNMNTLSLSADTLELSMKREKDLYPLARDLWAINREKDVRDFQIIPYGTQRTQTLEAIFLNVLDPSFPEKKKEGKAFIPATDRKLPYLYWKQYQRAPLVFVLPGVGSNRLSGGSMALAEMVYRNGFSVVLVSNALNWEFMEKAGTSAVPGYTPSDAKDVYAALNAIYLDMDRMYPGQFSQKALMGISLGALHTLFISSQQHRGLVEDLRFDRYLAINPPVDLPYALQKLDSYYNAPLAWEPAQREQRIWETLLKAVKMSEGMSQGHLTPSIELPFDKAEAEFLIGLNFKLILRDILFSSQSRENLGVLKSDLNRLRRNEAYEEMMGYSYTDYLNSFVLPYYVQKIPGATRERLLASASMPAIAEDMKANEKVRVYLNRNDFLLRPQDIGWIQSVLDENRLHVFEEGGHLGNLHQIRVQNRILDPLEDLKEK